MSRFAALGMTAAALLAAGAAPAHAMKEWTVIGYFVGDDEGNQPIEDSQIRDLLELDEVGSNGDVDLIVQMDRGPKLTRRMKQYYSDPNYSGGIRYHIKDGKWYTEEKLGEVNSGDPKTLYDTLKWAVEHHPAKRYALIINAHGSGVMSWRGVGSVKDSDPGAVNFDPFTGYDDTDGDCLTVFEIREVLRAFSDRLNGGRKLDLLGFDSCLSLMAEVLYEFRDGADVLVGSPALVPGSGLAYGPFARWLRRNPTANAEQLGEVITKTFIDSVGHVKDSQVMGAWRPAMAEELLSAMSRLSDELRRARRAGAKLSFQNQTSYNDRYWDLGRFTRSIRDGNTGVRTAANYGAIVEAAEAVDAARASARVSLWYDGTYAKSKVGGISVYWPEKDEYEGYRRYYKALSSSQDGRWDEFLDARELGIDAATE
jgi:hypothetical protein